jgi:sulfide:quinone oxidoreductase
VIAGGSVGALEAMLALRHLAADAVSVTLVCPRTYFEYRPMAVVEPFGGPAPRFDLGALAAAGGALHVRDAVAGVDPATRSVDLSAGGQLQYDFLVVTVGARAVVGVPGATPFWAGAGQQEFRELVAQLESGAVADAVVAVPGGATWPLPAYELALQTAHRLGADRARGRMVLVTPERAPLDVFGRRISAVVHDLLRERGVELVAASTPERFADGELRLARGGALPADRVVALPRLRGPAIPGLSQDDDGFLPTDEHGRVDGVDHVYAAGDAAAGPVKQGGIAAHQADAVAQSIALAAGLPVDPTPLRPVLRAVLLTGGKPLFLRRALADPGDPHGERAAVADHPFWWPPDKIAGRYLAPFLSAAEPLPSVVAPTAAAVSDLPASV